MGGRFPLRPLLFTTDLVLVIQVFAEGAGTRTDGGIHHQRQVAFSNARLTDRTIGDEREAVGILEPALSDDVTLEARGCSDAEVTAAAQNEQQLATSVYVGIRRLSSRSRSTAGGAP